MDKLVYDQIVANLSINELRFYLTLESPEAQQLIIAFCQQLKEVTK